MEDCLQSLLEQTYKNFEVLLVCDHTEEGVGSFVACYQNKLDLKIYQLQEKHGVAAARNYGISHATGDYIYFLDSDDYLDYNTMEIFAMTAEHENPDVIYGKKKKTWFTRNTYLINHIDNVSESEDNIDFYTNPDGQETSEEEPESENDILYHNRLKAYRHLISKKKDVKDISVLNIMIKRFLIINHDIHFNEDIIYLSDYPFVFQVLQCAEVFEYQKHAHYIKRNHNDPINSPSLLQLYANKDYRDFMKAYQYTTGKLELDEELRYLLDKKLLSFYINTFAPRLHRSEDKTELNRVFAKMHLLIQNVDPSVFNRYKGYKRRLVKALREGKLERSNTIVKQHLAWSKIKRMMKKRKELKKAFYFHVFLKMRVKENYVLCESFFGKSYSDNPKYIYEYISRNYPDKFKFIWVIDKKQTRIPYKHIRVKRFSLLYYYYLACSKYYVFNGRQPEWTKKREGNVFLQTWHGTPLKRLAFDIEDISSATARYKKQIFNQSRAWDYLVAPNQYSSDIFKNCFMYDNEMLQSGYPRNDILHKKNTKEMADIIKKKLGIPLNKNTILYAPTWRDDEYYKKGQYKFQLKLDMRLLKEKLSEDYIILLRTHYFIADSIEMDGLEGFVYNLSNYDDIAEIYLISDILITDYSSVFFDYANLGRPMIFYMYDLEKYRDVLRGFYIDIEDELPGPILAASEEVLHAIENINLLEQKYKEKYERFYEKYCSWEDGHASQRVAVKVFKL